jgi:hypothetical protein
MREVALNVQIIRTRMLAKVPVARGDYPSFDHTIIARSANFWLRWTAAAGKNDGSDHVQVSPKSKAHFEIRRIGFGHRSGFASLMPVATSPDH